MHQETRGEIGHRPLFEGPIEEQVADVEFANVGIPGIHLVLPDVWDQFAILGEEVRQELSADRRRNTSEGGSALVLMGGATLGSAVRSTVYEEEPFETIGDLDVGCIYPKHERRRTTPGKVDSIVAAKVGSWPTASKVNLCTNLRPSRLFAPNLGSVKAAEYELRGYDFFKNERGISLFYKPLMYFSPSYPTVVNEHNTEVLLDALKLIYERGGTGVYKWLDYSKTLLNSWIKMHRVFGKHLHLPHNKQAGPNSAIEHVDALNARVHDNMVSFIGSTGSEDLLREEMLGYSYRFKNDYALL